MSELRLLRPLNTATSAEEGRPNHLAAASGAVHHQGVLYVIADDEQSLAAFADDGSAGQWVPLLPGELPLDPVMRKAVKADFETLTLLPASDKLPFGALFALGSGSHARRRWGAVVPFAEDGRCTVARRVDLQPLFESLRGRITRLNIEGAVAVGDELVLLQRGTAGSSANALVKLNLPSTLEAVCSSKPLTGELIKDILEVSLPKIDGVQLSLTDGVALGGTRILFSAVAERTEDPYLDGPCAGSVVGAMTLDGKVLGAETVRPLAKIEGLAIVREKLWLVTDDDKPEAPAKLYETAIPRF